MTTDEAITVLGHAKADAIECRLIDESGHYGMGYAYGTFYWLYVCCDPECEWNEFEVFSGLEELARIIPKAEWRWERKEAAK